MSDTKYTSNVNIKFYFSLYEMRTRISFQSQISSMCRRFYTFYFSFSHSNCRHLFIVVRIREILRFKRFPTFFSFFFLWLFLFSYPQPCTLTMQADECDIQKLFQILFIQNDMVFVHYDVFVTPMRRATHFYIFAHW